MYMQFPHKRPEAGIEPSPVVLKRQRVQPMNCSSFLDSPSKELTSPHPKAYSSNTFHNPSYQNSDVTSKSITPSLHLIQTSNNQFGFGSFHVTPNPQHNTCGHHSHSNSVQRPQDTEVKSSPPSPSSLQHQWWLQQPRPVHPSSPTTSSCYYCEAPDNHIACERCDHRLCEMCTRFCDDCSATWCPSCTLLDYDSTFDRTLCFECYYDKHGKPHIYGHGNADGSVDSDGDGIMPSWQ